MSRSSDCLLSDNIANSSRASSIYLYYSSNCVLGGNTANSDYGECGIGLYHSNNCVLKNNTANSNLYAQYGGIYLHYSSNCVLEGNTANLNGEYVAGGGPGIYLRFSNNSMIESNTANSNVDGIVLRYSSNSKLRDNIANSNSHGIDLFGSSSCMLEGNIANQNYAGISLYHSSNCNIIDSIADSNGYGIRLESTSTNNTVTENTLSNNDYGVYHDYSSNNIIYHNNFINNDEQAYERHGFNDWDKGPIIGGNYWSDHVCHGNPSNGTEPYTGIDTDSVAVDNYPFEDPYGWTSIPTPTGSFDTGSGGYPSIMGNHTGTIKPNHTVIATKMYTYPCSGTGGHTEYVKIWNSTWNATAIWDGYSGDWHNISFSEPFTLKEGVTYNYTIITGSYPQIHHTDRLERDDGEITCAAFIDANGKRHNNWIPAIRLE